MVAEPLSQDIVLLSRSIHADHVVEEELCLIGRSEPPQFVVRPVNDHPPQRSQITPRRRDRQRAHSLGLTARCG